MHIFYQPDLTLDYLTLSEDESKHCIRVLRLKQFDTLELADGMGNQATAEIRVDNPKKTELQIIRRVKHTINRKYHLTIAIAPTKNFDRIEWFIEKATECGIDEIVFIETKNSERSKINLERCHKIAISAMKQSKQWWLPKIITLVAFKDFIEEESSNDELRLIAWCPENTKSLTHQILSNSNKTSIKIVVGPEGDFTKEETDKASAMGFIPISLGNSILRTETAGLYACMAVKAIKDSN